MTDRPNIEALAHELWAMAQLAPGEGIEDGAARIATALAAQAAAVPQGWKLMPEGLTDTMLIDACNAACWRVTKQSIADVRAAYRAMLSAAPPAPAPVERKPQEHEIPAGATLDRRPEGTYWTMPASPAPVAAPEEPIIDANIERPRFIAWHAINGNNTQFSAWLGAKNEAQTQVDVLSFLLRECANMLEAREREQSLPKRERYVGNSAHYVKSLVERARGELAALRSVPTGAQPLTYTLTPVQVSALCVEICHRKPSNDWMDEPLNAVGALLDADHTRIHRNAFNALDASFHGITGTPAADGEVR